MKQKVAVADGNNPTTLLAPGLYQMIVLDNQSNADILIDLTGEGTFTDPSTAAGLTLQHTDGYKQLVLTAERNKYLPITKGIRALHAGSGDKNVVVQAIGRAT